MRLDVHGKGLEVTEALRDYVEKRLSKLERYFPHDEVSAQVVLTVQRDRQIVEVTIPLEGRLLRAEEAHPSMYAAVDLVLEKLERQIHKYKTRLVRRPRHAAALDSQQQRGGHEASGDEESESGDEDDPLAQVERRKTFLLKPMTLEEAVLQMDLLGHDFFVFRDGDGGVQVLYRRRNGSLGLITER
jgi:putative sigma-54 modulation protein